MCERKDFRFLFCMLLWFLCLWSLCSCNVLCMAQKQLLCVPLFCVLKDEVLMEHPDEDLVNLQCSWCGDWSLNIAPSHGPRLASWDLMHNQPGTYRPGCLVTSITDKTSLHFICSLVRNLMSVRMRVLYHLMILVVGHSARIFIHVPTACDTARSKQTFYYKAYKDIKQ